MNATKILVAALCRKYDRLLSDYTFNMNAGDPEQDAIAEELDEVAWELDNLQHGYLRGKPTTECTQNDNWGQDALDMFSKADDEFFINGVGGPPGRRWLN